MTSHGRVIRVSSPSWLEPRSLFLGGVIGAALALSLVWGLSWLS